jgi:hypothetical protein
MKRKTIKTPLFITFLLFQINCFSQTNISGTISNTSEKLSSVSVVLKDSISDTILDYTYSLDNGTYQLSTSKKGKFALTFSSLGYKSKTVFLEINNQPKITVNAVLEDHPFEINEIIIQSEKDIKVKKDTITFKTKFFVNGTEQTVEDLLKKIPGLNIDANGTIKVGNQEIEKLMVDGDDLFEKGYKILSKNMPAYPIEEVEVLKRYSNNRLLKDIEESNKVALNLKLKDDAKRIWFGNTTIGLGNNNFYEIKGNLMNFGKKNKYYFLTNLNSIGYDSTGDIENLIRPYRGDEPGSIGDDQQVASLLSLSNTSGLDFKRSRTNFNNAEMVSLNAIFNPTEKLKIKTLGFFNTDETDFFRNSQEIFNVGNTIFTNTENFALRNKKIIGFGKLDINYNISKTETFETVTKYNDGNYTANSNLVFNGKTTLENLKSNNHLFDQKINYTNKFKDSKVFLLTGRFINEETPQNYAVNQFLFDELFSNTTANNVAQQNTNKMIFGGVNAHLLDRKENGNLLEIQLGNEFRKDILQTNFGLFEDETLIENPIDYQNNTTYYVNNSYLKTKYRYKLKDVAFSGTLNFHQLYNRLETELDSKDENPFFINPSIGLDWKINERNKIITSYAYNYRNAGILDIYNQFVLTGFRSFNKGTGNFNQLNSSNFMINYQLGNWSDRFFANTFIMYNKNYDFFSTNSIITQNYVQSEKIVIKDSEFFSINTNFDYYFNVISSNLKLDLGYTKNNFKNSINNSDFRDITSNSTQYGFELRSGFQGIFNYHIGTKWHTNTIKTTIENSFTNNTSFLDISLIFNDLFDVQLQSERYYFGNLENNNTYYFLDVNARYKVVKDKVTLNFSGKNLFNTQTFRNFSISDFGSSTTEYRLLPRMILVGLEYRF